MSFWDLFRRRSFPDDLDHWLAHCSEQEVWDKIVVERVLVIQGVDEDTAKRNAIATCYWARRGNRKQRAEARETINGAHLMVKLDPKIKAAWDDYLQRRMRKCMDEAEDEHSGSTSRR